MVAPHIEQTGTCKRTILNYKVVLVEVPHGDSYRTAAPQGGPRGTSQRPNLPRGGRMSEVAARAHPKTPEALKNAI